MFNILSIKIIENENAMTCWHESFTHMRSVGMKILLAIKISKECSNSVPINVTHFKSNETYFTHIKEYFAQINL